MWKRPKDDLQGTIHKSQLIMNILSDMRVNLNQKSIQIEHISKIFIDKTADICRACRRLKVITLETQHYWSESNNHILN